MVAVALIVTGDMEQYALARSLKNVFPEADFTVQKVDGFTSTKVSWPPPTARGVRSTLEKYVTAFLAALDPGRRQPRPDYVFGIDDLELENREQPEEVIQAFRSAVTAELENRRRNMNAPAYDKFVARVKDHCSFHLFVPMAEAYFYADPGALQAAGCTRQAILALDCDVEQFQTTDPDYLADPPPPRPPWAIDPISRPLHPKRYLQFLLDPALYSETEQGCNALLAINWRTVLAQPQQTLFLRSLFQDLADALDRDISDFQGDAHPLTSDYRRRDRILRNF